jgi:hypothetical protein
MYRYEFLNVSAYTPMTTGQEETAVWSFENPAFGSNKCSINGMAGSCTAGKGLNAGFVYHLRGK